MLFTSLCHHRAQPEQTRGWRTATWGGGDSKTTVITLNQPSVTGDSPQEERWCIAWGASGLRLGCQIAKAAMTTTAQKPKPHYSLWLSLKLFLVLNKVDVATVVFASVDSWLMRNIPSRHKGADTEKNLSCFCSDRAVLLSYWGQRQQISPQQHWIEGFWK